MRSLLYCCMFFVVIPLFRCQEEEEGEKGAEEREAVYIGTIFEKEDEEMELALNLTVESINEQALLYGYELKYVSLLAEPDHPFLAIEAACSLLQNNVVGIIGPPSEENANAMQSLCDNKEIPLIETRWDAEQKPPTSSLNIHPYPPVLAKVFVDIVEASDWKSFTILYESREGLFRISELLRMYNTSGHTIVVRQLDSDNSGDYRSTFRDVLQSGEKYLILDCSIDSLDEVLRQAQQVGIITHEFKLIITNLDFHTIDLESYRYGGTNITGVRLLNPNNLLVEDISKKILESRLSDPVSSNFDFSTIDPNWTIRLDVALTIDAVRILTTALSEIITTDMFNPRPLLCDSTDNSKFGTSLLNNIKTNTFLGLSGPIKFDNTGYRSEFSLEMIELTAQGLKKTGNWNPTTGLSIVREAPQVSVIDESTLRNRSFVVITALTAPYAMMKKSEPKLTGNDQYEGFGIDLIKELSLLEGFTFEIKIRGDKANGDFVNGQWTGMIGEIVNGSADLAIGDLTITGEREEAVDFTTPFMNLGVSVLYRKPTKAPPGFFSFAAPFANDVWLTLSGAYLCVSVAFYVTGRLSPSEWTNPFPCIEEPKYLLNQFSLRNSFWFTIGSLMQQGSEIAPIAISTRMVASMWWFFTLIMVSSYTANLAAFLTADAPLTEFSSVKELAERAERLGIRYGAKKGGATAKFFKNSNNPDYQKIWRYMDQHSEDMPGENYIGVQWAEEEGFKYAFFMESTSIEYEIQRHCNLSQVGGKLDEKGYAIAMKKNSSYRHLLTAALLKLQESGKITEIKRKWWEERGVQCAAEEEAQEAPPLDLVNVSGIFWVTIGGIILAFVFVCVEMLVHVVQISVKYRVPFSKEIVEEVKNSFAPTKPVRQRLQSPEGSEKSQVNSVEKINPVYGFSPEILERLNSH